MLKYITIGILAGLALAPCRVCWTIPVWKGYAGLTIEELRREEAPYTRLQENLHLGMQDHWGEDKEIELEMDAIWDERSDREYTDFFPTTYLNLRGRGYQLYTRYSDYENKGYTLGGSLNNESVDMTLRLMVPEFPQVAFTYSEANSQDELSPHQTDNASVSRSVVTNFPVGESRLFATYSDNEFTNNVTGVSTFVLLNPAGIYVDGPGSIYVADRGNNRIAKFDSAGSLISSFGSFGSGDGQFNAPEGVTVDSAGNIYVADTQNNRVVKLRTDGGFTTSWGHIGSGDGEFLYPEGIAVDTSNNVYVADTENHRIQKFDSDGNFLLKWGTEGSGNGQFSDPASIAIDLSNNVYVADTENHRIQKFDTNGNFILRWGGFGSDAGFFFSPEGITTDESGMVYAADTGNHRVQKFDPFGTFLDQWGSQGAGESQFSSPQGIASDRRGFVYVADTQNNRLQKFRNDGEFQLEFGGAGIELEPDVRKSSNASLGYNFGFKPYEGVQFSGNYNLYDFRNESQDVLQSETLTHNFSLAGSASPWEKVTLSSSLTYDTSETEQLELEPFVSDHLRHAYLIAVHPYHSLQTSAGYSIDDSRVEGGDKNVIDTTSFQASAPLREEVSVSLSLSRVNSRLNDSLIAVTDNGGLSSGIHIRENMDLNVGLYLIETDSIQADTKTESQYMRFDLATKPTRKLSMDLGYGFTNSEVLSAAAPSESEQDSFSLDFTFVPMAKFSLNAGLDYFLNRPQGAEEQKDLTFSTAISWSLKEWAILHLSYTGRDDTTSNETFNTQLIFNFRKGLYINLSRQLYWAEGDDREFTYVQITKSF